MKTCFSLSSSQKKTGIYHLHLKIRHFHIFIAKQIASPLFSRLKLRISPLSPIKKRLFPFIHFLSQQALFVSLDKAEENSSKVIGQMGKFELMHTVSS